MKVIRLNENDIEKLVGKIIDESHMFGYNKPNKMSPDERIAYYILEKLEKERPEIQHQFVDSQFQVTDFFGIQVDSGVMEADMFRVNFTNKSAGISKNQNGILVGGDFGIVKVYNVLYRSDLGRKKNVIRYAIKMTGDRDALNIPNSLGKKIYNKIEDQYGDIRVFKAQRKIDKVVDDESDLFDELNK